MLNKKLIIFDLGNVMVDIDMAKTISEFEKLGVRGIEKNVTQSHSVGGVFTDFEQGKVSPEEFCEAIRQMSGISASDAEIRAAWNAMIAPLPEEKVRLVEKLKKEHTVILLSNTNQIHKEYFDGMASQWGYPSLSDLFDRTFYSHEMHLSKPNTKIFVEVLREMEVPANEAIFFDDSTKNVEASASLGIESKIVDINGEGIWKWF